MPTESPRRIARLARVVADGGPIDWIATQREVSQRKEVDLIRSLRLIQWTHVSSGQSTIQTRALAPPTPLHPAFQALLILTAAQAVTAVIIATFVGGPNRSVPPTLALATVVAFAIAALVLGFGGKFDHRARSLAGFLAAAASAPSQPFLGWDVTSRAPGILITGGLSVALFECFLPYFLWRFVRDFPHAISYGRGGQRLEVLLKVCATLGAGLFTVNGLHRLGFLGSLAQTEPISWLLRSSDGPYWPLLFLTALPAPLVAFVRARRARTEEQRRVTVFLSGLAMGILPLLLLSLAETLLPAVNRLMDLPRFRFFGSLVVYGGLLTVPLITSYSVVAHDVLELRLILRKATRFALARWTLSALCLLPLFWVVLLAWRHRHLPLSELLDRPVAVTMLIVTIIAFFLFAFRQPLLNSAEGYFVGRNAPHSAILESFSSTVGQARDLAELSHHLVTHARQLTGAMDGAVWHSNGTDGDYACLTQTGRVLPKDSLVAHLARNYRGPIVVDPYFEGSLFPLLPETDRQWVADHKVSTVVPIAKHAGGATLLTLEQPKGGTAPTDTEDRALAALAATGALVWNRHPSLIQAPGSPPLEIAQDQPAGECLRCQRVVSQPNETCICGETFRAASIPRMLAGKFLLQGVLGEGGMGRVYLARDESLDRLVALKTLPRLASDPLLRLRREARAMAALDHPRLATLYGVETWRGVLILVVEYLAGGTLAKRLETSQASPLDPWRAVDLARQVLEGLTAMHESGYLHRDLKPSNIGLTAAGQPKLLDFGLARLIEEAGISFEGAESQVESLRRESVGLIDKLPAELTRTGHLVGTPLYMSPETLAGAPPSVAQDLWSLHLVLWELLAGHHPLAGCSPEQAIRQQRAGRLPDPKNQIRDCPTPVLEALRLGLHPDPNARPLTARAARIVLNDLGRAAA